MKFVDDEDAFRRHLRTMDSLFLRDKRLPDKVLSERLRCGGFVEETLMSGSFFERLKAFLTKLGENKFYLAVTVPDPEDYFFREPGSHPIIEVSVLDTKNEYVAFLQGERRGDSLVGTMLYQAQVTLVYSDSANWGIHFDNRDLEIGVAGFANARLNAEFISAYDPKYIFTAEEVIEVVVKNVFIHAPGGVPNDIRDQLIKNYPATC